MKTPFSLAILLLALTLPLYIKAQSPNPSAFIIISGKGTVNAQPDVAQVTISFKLRERTANALTDLLNNRSSAVTAILQRANVTDSDIDSSSSSIWPYYTGSTAYGNSGPNFYDGTKSIVFIIRNMSNYDSVIVQLYAAGVTTVDSVVFQLSNELLQKKKLEAKKNAAENAKQIIDILTEGLGLKIGEAYAVSESTDGGDPQTYTGPANTVANEISTGEVVVSAEGGVDTTEAANGPTLPSEIFTIYSSVNTQFYLV